MKISIIIPTYNEEKDISFCLSSLKKQSFKDLEIIVVDDGSTDKTVNIVKEFAEVKIINGMHKGPGFSRNIGAKKAIGKVLVFVDADMTFDKDYIKKLTAPILNDLAVIGTTHELEIVKNTSNIWSRCWGKIRVSKENAADIKIFRAIRKSEFIKLGGFDPKYGYADDQSLWFNHQVRPTVAKDTVCYHKNPESLNSVYKQSRWIGASIDYRVINIPIIKYFLPFILFLIFPILIPVFSIKRCSKNNEYSIFFQMLIFMTFRYFGTIMGLFRRVYLGKNFR